MDETMIPSGAEPQDQGDAFLEGWDDAEPTSTPADQPADEGEAQSGAAPKADPAPDGGAKSEDPKTDPETTGAEGETPHEPGEGKEGEGQEAQAPTSWDVKHMGEKRTITAAEITPELLQKGLDYDRVREKYDEAKPVMEMFSQFAAKAGMSVPDYVKRVRAEAHKAAGMSEDEAKRTVELEDREAAVAAKEAEKQAETTAKETQNAELDRDLDQFAKAFPDVFATAQGDPKVIPESVWEDVRKGMTLTAAYSKYAVAQAKAEAQTAKEQAETAGKNAQNATRSTGSMKSAGSDTKPKDPFLDGFGD